MSTTVEPTMMMMPNGEMAIKGELTLDDKMKMKSTTMTMGKKDVHPLHQFDATQMCKFYESCVTKMTEQHPKCKEGEWTQVKPMPEHLSAEEKRQWCNPIVMSSKQVCIIVSQ